jgi:hypothetical protein
MQKLRDATDVLRVLLAEQFDLRMAIKAKMRKATLQTLRYHLPMLPTILLHSSNCLINVIRFYPM